MTFPPALSPVRLALAALVLAWLTAWSLAWAAEPSAMPAEESPTHHMHMAAAASPEVGLEEHLGAKIPLDLTFRDEQGKQVTLRELIDVPTIIAPVYYQCPNVCSFLQGELTRVLPKLKLKPGSQYRVLSISFDETETPLLAADSKRNFLAAMPKDFPPEAWKFLTGDRENILRLTDTAGYHFERKGTEFIHPVAIIIVSTDGTIARYLSGTQFLPMDISLALIEASEGRVGATIRQVASFCFTYDPAKKTYVFNLLRVAATVTIATAAAFLAFLILSGRKRRQR